MVMVMKKKRMMISNSIIILLYSFQIHISFMFFLHLFYILYFADFKVYVVPYFDIKRKTNHFAFVYLICFIAFSVIYGWKKYGILLLYLLFIVFDFWLEHHFNFNLLKICTSYYEYKVWAALCLIAIVSLRTLLTINSNSHSTSSTISCVILWNGMLFTDILSGTYLLLFVCFGT